MTALLAIVSLVLLIYSVAITLTSKPSRELRSELARVRESELDLTHRSRKQASRILILSAACDHYRRQLRDVRKSLAVAEKELSDADTDDKDEDRAEEEEEEDE